MAMDKPSFFIGTVLILAVVVFFPSIILGDLYMWTDEQGIRHYSNVSPPKKGMITRLEEQPISLPRGFSCRVINIYDGDTIQVTGEDLAFKVRLAGIDCPESRWGKRPEQPFAREAKQVLVNRILGKSVILKQHGIGGYNRILAEVFFRGENINLTLVRQGMAEVYQGRLPRSLESLRFQAAQKQARQSKVGIWSLGKAYVSPKKWRKRYPAK